MDTDGTLDQKSRMRTWSGRQDDPNYPICASMTWGLLDLGERETMRRNFKARTWATKQHLYLPGDIWRCMASSLHLLCVSECSQGSSGWVGLICLSRLASQIFDSDKNSWPREGSSCNDERHREAFARPQAFSGMETAPVE